MAGESALTLAGLEAMLAPHRLEVLGGFAVDPEEEGFRQARRRWCCWGRPSRGSGRIFRRNLNGGGPTRWTAGRAG